MEKQDEIGGDNATWKTYEVRVTIEVDVTLNAPDAEEARLNAQDIVGVKAGRHLASCLFDAEMRHTSAFEAEEVSHGKAR